MSVSPDRTANGIMQPVTTEILKVHRRQSSTASGEDHADPMETRAGTASSRGKPVRHPVSLDAGHRPGLPRGLLRAEKAELRISDLLGLCKYEVRAELKGGITKKLGICIL